MYDDFLLYLFNAKYGNQIMEDSNNVFSKTKIIEDKLVNELSIKHNDLLQELILQIKDNFDENEDKHLIQAIKFGILLGCSYQSIFSDWPEIVF